MNRTSIFSFFTLSLLVAGCSKSSNDPTTESQPVASVQTQDKNYHVERSWPDYFLEHKKYFEPQTYKIEGAPIWSINNPENWAVNCTLIEGDDELIVYDTGLSRENGEACLAEIRKISDKPIRTIFYSHHHPDHYNGTDALVSAEDVRAGRVKIYAWENFEEELASEWGATGPIQALRVGYYTGTFLPEEDRHHHGCCGSRYGGTSGYIPPTDTFNANITLTISGVRIEVIYTGGEASSEFGLRLPEYRTVIVADEIYPAHPNMYTIRGAQFRITEGYLRAYDTVLAFDDTEHLLGSHMPPINGREEIQSVVTKYRDLVQYVHDQSVRRINKGDGIPELRETFNEVPEWLELEPYNMEMYGTLEHNAAQQFAGYMGWFNGDPTDHRPTPSREAASRYVELMGGRNAVFSAAEQAFEDGDPQWTAELLRHVLRINPGDSDARHLKAAALRTLGYQELNTTWRAWYLTAALEYEYAIDLEAIGTFFGAIIFPDPESASLRSIFENYRYRVDADAVGGQNLSLAIDVETDEDLTLTLRNGVLILEEGVSADADVVMSVARSDLNPVLRGEATWTELVFESTGDTDLARSFWGYFDTEIFADHIAVR